jgi:hypothetical protein
MNSSPRPDGTHNHPDREGSPDLLSGTTSRSLQDALDGPAAAGLRRNASGDKPCSDVEMGVVGLVAEQDSSEPRSNATGATATGDGEMASRSVAAHPFSFFFQLVKKVAVTYAKFIGPGLMVMRTPFFCTKMGFIIYVAYSSRFPLRILIREIIPRMLRQVVVTASSSCLLFSCRILLPSISKPYASS